MNVFIFGVGGGGDVVSALIPYRQLARRGHVVYLGSVVWERRVEDPIPGPICNDSWREVEVINRWVSLVNEKSYAVRGGRLIIPQIVRVAKVLGTKLFSLCLEGGSKGLFTALREVSQSLSLDAIIGVDAGGDVLAIGDEEGLSSPLADSISLASLVRLKREGLNTSLQVVGLGADGELDPAYLLSRISKIASMGGLLEVGGLDRDVALLLEDVLANVNTEASRIPLLAFRGTYGEITIRQGLAKVFVSPLQAVSFTLDPEVVIRDSMTAKAVYESNSIDEADTSLNRLNLYTELDLERDIYAMFGEKASEIPPEVVKSLRSRRVQKRF